MTVAPDQAFYVYAVLAGGARASQVAPAVLPGVAVETVQQGALAALVSVVPRCLFAADHADSRSADPDWVAERAEAHHRVVERAASNGPCLPLGFGTLFTSGAALRHWLAENAARMHRTLERLADKEEWALTLLEDAPAHAAWLETHDPDIKRLSEASRAAPPGTQFLLERRLARTLEAARARHAAALGAMLMEGLQAMGGLVHQETALKGAAWSILADRQSGFLERAEALGHAVLADTGLALRASGPWPPYAFARAAWQEQAHA
jgi:hypothetical protein